MNSESNRCNSKRTANYFRIIVLHVIFKNVKSRYFQLLCIIWHLIIMMTQYVVNLFSITKGQGNILDNNKSRTLYKCLEENIILQMV